MINIGCQGVSLHHVSKLWNYVTGVSLHHVSKLWNYVTHKFMIYMIYQSKNNKSVVSFSLRLSLRKVRKYPISVNNLTKPKSTQPKYLAWS